MMQAVQLRVVSGPQKNAGMTLSVGDSISVGGDVEDGILLRDPSLEGRALQLQIEATAIVVQVVAGTVFVNETRLTAQQSLRQTDEVLVKLGNTHLHLSRAPATEPLRADDTELGQQADLRAAQTADEMNADKPDTVSSAVSTVDTASEPGNGVSGVTAAGSAYRRSSARRSSRWILRAGSCALGLLLLCLTLGVTGVLGRGDDQAAPDLSLAARLSTEGFGTLSVDRQVTPVVVQGFLATREESMRLDRLLRREPGTVRNRVMVGEELASRVQEVFRLNGVEAKVSVPVVGEARAFTQVADETVLQRIAGQARHDIPQLTSLELNNTVPLAVAAPVPPARDVPGKRVAMVVSAAPAHVITEDRSRYFVGSLLPSGHRIMSIEAGTVSLIKAGQRTDLEF